MKLRELNILNWKNIREAEMQFSDKLNCIVGLNGQGKTNILDAVYLLSFTKSAFNATDSQNILHDEAACFVQGRYIDEARPEAEDTVISCGIKRGQKKQFRRGKKDYKRLNEHIGLIPLVMVSPADAELIAEGSDERRRFMDQVLAQRDRSYLEDLTLYQGLVKQRNALLKQYEGQDSMPWDLMEVIETQMIQPAEHLYRERSRYIETFTPIFQELYNEICGGKEQVGLRYVSQLQDRNLGEALVRTRQRDLILGWTSQGVHKDELEMTLDGYPIKRVGSQGQQKTYLLSLKLAQALYLSEQPQILNHKSEIRNPILLLDDLFDKLDKQRVERIVSLLGSERFGQILMTDTDLRHLTEIVRPNENAKIFTVTNGQIH